MINYLSVLMRGLSVPWALDVDAVYEEIRQDIVFDGGDA